MFEHVFCLEVVYMEIHDERSEVEHRISHMLILSVTTASFICVTVRKYYCISLRMINVFTI